MILLLKRGNCDFVVKVRNAQAISAKAVVIYDTSKNLTSLPIMVIIETLSSSSLMNIRLMMELDLMFISPLS